MTDHSDLTPGRIRHIREVCLHCLNRDASGSDRAWLAATVLNILNGNIDDQIRGETQREKSGPKSPHCTMHLAEECDCAHVEEQDRL